MKVALRVARTRRALLYVERKTSRRRVDVFCSGAWVSSRRLRPERSSAISSKSVEIGQDVQPSAFAMVTHPLRWFTQRVSGVPSLFGTQCQGRRAKGPPPISFHSSSVFSTRRHGKARATERQKTTEAETLSYAFIYLFPCTDWCLLALHGSWIEISSSSSACPGICSGVTQPGVTAACWPLKGPRGKTGSG